MLQHVCGDRREQVQTRTRVKRRECANAGMQMHARARGRGCVTTRLYCTNFDTYDTVGAQQQVRPLASLQGARTLPHWISEPRISACCKFLSALPTFKAQLRCSPIPAEGCSHGACRTRSTTCTRARTTGF